MFFKAINVFNVEFTPEKMGAEPLTGLELDDKLQADLSEKAFQPCAKAAMSSYGWISPLGDDGMLTHTVGKYIMICARKQEKILPAAALNEELNSRIAHLENTRGYKMPKRDKTALKEDIRGEMIIKAFTKSKEMYAYIDLEAGKIVLNKCGKGDVEEFVDYLYETFGDIEVLPIMHQASPSVIFTSWLSNQCAADGFRIEEWGQLTDSAGLGGLVTLKDLDLYSDEVQNHLIAGKEVKALQICWRDSISFKVDADLKLTAVKFHEIIIEKSNDSDPETAVEQFDSDMAVMTLELSQLLGDLLGSFTKG